MGPCSVFSTAGCVALCYVPNWSRTDIVSVLTICLIALVIVTARGEPRLSSGREELCLETITSRHCSHLIILRELKRKAHLENHLLRLSLGVLTLNTELQKYSDISNSQFQIEELSPSIQSSSYFSLEALLCVLAVTNYRAEYRTNDCGVRKLKIVTLTFAAAGCSNWSGCSAPAAPRLGTKVQPLHSGRQSGSCEAMLVFTSFSS